MNLDFDQVLQESSRSFEKWRYSFEGSPGGAPSEWLFEGLLVFLLKLRTDWLPIRDSMDFPDTSQDQKIQTQGGVLILPPWFDTQ